ncbi:hypothetical protein [Lactiplantibacillus plantarum]|uniref:hypothetical protein n=1 Tax=Lactiplantibacillus plantarum TaxID=1590 RepID=UPI0021CB25C6|nr:hypothetical protein [Lactiplantibacillus plantarum]
MTISWLQAALLGLFACLCSNSCMAGQAVGNYTIGRPLVGGLFVVLFLEIFNLVLLVVLQCSWFTLR